MFELVIHSTLRGSCGDMRVQPRNTGNCVAWSGGRSAARASRQGLTSASSVVSAAVCTASWLFASIRRKPTPTVSLLYGMCPVYRTIMRCPPASRAAEEAGSPRRRFAIGVRPLSPGAGGIFWGISTRGEGFCQAFTIVMRATRVEKEPGRQQEGGGWGRGKERGDDRLLIQPHATNHRRRTMDRPVHSVVRPYFILMMQE